jgi:hypothetical protein
MKQLAIFLLAILMHNHSAFCQDEPKLLRLGIVGLETSHVPAFTNLFNNPKAVGDLAAFKVVAGYPGGTDMPASRDRRIGKG